MALNRKLFYCETIHKGPSPPRKIHASINIQRVCRGHTGRKLFTKCWWLREKDRENLRFEAFMLERLRWLSAIMIQKHYRGWCGRCKFEIHKKLVESIIVVQRVWRAKQARMLTLMLRHYEAQKLLHQQQYKNFFGGI